MQILYQNSSHVRKPYNKKHAENIKKTHGPRKLESVGHAGKIKMRMLKQVSNDNSAEESLCLEAICKMDCILQFKDLMWLKARFARRCSKYYKSVEVLKVKEVRSIAMVAFVTFEDISRFALNMPSTCTSNM